jgi:hypothetical protein
MALALLGSRERRPRRSRDGRRHPVAVLAVALATVGALVLPATHAVAADPDTTVTLNLAQTGKVPTHAGSGFLYGLSQDGTQPSQNLLAPLDPTLFRGGGARIAGDGWIGDGYTAGSGFQVRMTSALDQAAQVGAAPYDATYHLLVSDLYGADTTQPSNTVYPCDNGNCANWTTFIDTVVADVQASGLKNIDFDIWNEPDGTGFWPRGVNSAQYFEMWNTAVDDIRGIDPSAVIVGPSFSQYNSSFMQTWLSTTQADGTLPNVLNWHFGDDPVADATETESIESSLGISPIPLTVNEYMQSADQNAGDTAWWLDRFAVSDITQAAHAIWSNCCTDPTLDSVLSGTGALAAPTGQWWVYRAYAELSGNMVTGTSGDADIAVAASENQSQDQAVALIGNDSGETGTTTIQVNGLSSVPWIESNGDVNLTLQRIPDQNYLFEPQTITDESVPVVNGSVSIPATFEDSTDAYFLTISPTNTGGLQAQGPTTTVVDGNTTGSAVDQFSYGANWGVTTGVSDMYDGTANWSYTAGATAKFTFSGDQVALHAVKDVDQGIMSVSIDGGTPVNVDDYSPTRNASGIVWTSPVLSTGTHTLTIVNTGQKDSASSGYNIAIDRADVYQGETIDDSWTGTGQDEFNYSSGWGVTTGITDMYAGTAHWDPTAGATATFTFTGNEAALHAVQDVDQGQMTVSVDGGTPTTVDDYSATRNANAIVWTSGALASGTHTVTITVLGQKDAASSGTTIALDSMDVIDN